MKDRILTAAAVAFLLLVANSFYLFSFASPTIFYMSNVLAHLALGGMCLAAAVWLWMGSETFREKLGWTLWPLLAVFLSGIALVYTGASNDFRWLLWGHISVSLLAALAIAVRVKWKPLTGVYAGCAALAMLVAGYGAAFRPDVRIVNTVSAPSSMEEEGGGPKSPFWPSSAKTNVGGTIPSNFFMDSKLCGECHVDIYRQWQSSMHRFSSFNNQFYRKSIEHMQEISGTKGSKWCAGCHDHAMFFNGRFEIPVKEQIDTPEAQNGLGCVSCHSIVHVEGSMGNGGFTIEYPPLHDLASSRNPYIRLLDRFLTHIEPEPHRRTFMKPFMRKDSAEFCSTCHKVHLDVPVNNYRWLRGFNDYDNWQASGVSGQGARSFYYPQKPMVCADCHMPMVRSNDPGQRGGFVHDHRFAAANSAVAVANGDEAQLKAVEGFLKSGFISVDIFSASPADSAPETGMIRRSGEQSQQAMSTFAVGEEAEQSGQYFLREVGRVAAPLDVSDVEFRPGDTLRVDVVVRTRRIGHFFPGGTVDAFDVWLELEGRDAAGKTVFWSGATADGGKGPVEKGAHFYRSLMLDGEGNPVNKRNAWQTRSLLYVRLIPPGAADVAHYRVRIPPGAKGPITLTAKLNYRKFSHYYTQYAYAGKAKGGPDGSAAGLHHDSRDYTFDAANIPANVSGNVKGKIPDIPIITLARAETTLRIAGGGVQTQWKPVVRKLDRERWNDWGIGLLLQGDLKGAEYAFKKVTEADPDYADGWLNGARALIQEGEIEPARELIAKALRLSPNLARAHFFQGMAEKADGDYDGALASLRRVEAQYPRDRVVLNQIGRLLFLKRDYAAARAAFERVLTVDPEDVQAHYSLMLVYRGLGDMESSRREEILFKRFKADESAQVLTAKMRQTSPEDNNERQSIHEHESIPLK